MEASDREHSGGGRADRPGDERLKIHGEERGGRCRVDAEVRRRGVPSFPLDINTEAIRGRHAGTGLQ